MYDIFDFMKIPSIDLLSKTLKSSKLFGASATKTMIYNKYVLYFVFFVAIFQLLYSAVHQDYLYCILFVLVGFLVHFFNKNMTIILTLSIATTTIIRNILKGGQLKLEGLTTSEDSNENDNEKKDVTVKKEIVDAQQPSMKKNSKEEYSPKNPKSDEITATTSPAALMDILQQKAYDLQDTQKEIISGFEKIEPHMSRAEELIGSIENMADKIQSIKNQSVA